MKTSIVTTEMNTVDINLRIKMAENMGERQPGNYYL